MGAHKACMKEFNPNSKRSRDYYIDKWTLIVRKMIGMVVE